MYNTNDFHFSGPNLDFVLSAIRNFIIEITIKKIECIFIIIFSNDCCNRFWSERKCPVCQEKFDAILLLLLLLLMQVQDCLEKPKRCL